MDNKNKPKFLLCAKYDFKIVLRNRQLGGLPMETRSCQTCAVKVCVAPASLELLARDGEIKPLCYECAAKLNAELGEPQYTMTRGQLLEAAQILAKIKAANN